MLDLEIDGKALEVPEGSTVMDACNKLGVYVPHFCYHRKLSIAANCRMCLVHVEKAPKPLPACATPVTKGMKVWTHSDLAVDAQKGVMEFLLINHPLDCPICDQGGECQLQDLAVGYGASGSRYEEDKRVVVNKNLGPLISTDMTRCIHCTRCIRFGQEIAGIMELGMIGRGEHAEIITFVGKTVDSELSGNVIDLCPVGALTSKPFRYSARTWELTRRPSISPHDSLGANLIVQIKQNRVMRVLPRENEAINECWLSDRDRFSYEGLNSEQRLARPMLKRDGTWETVDWKVALEFVATRLKEIREKHGASSIGALALPHQTLEELYLLQKLVRGLGSNNVDFRLRQSDFSADGKSAGAPWLGMPIQDIPLLDQVLVVGSTLRREHPLLAHRIRQGTKKNLKLSILHAVDDDLLMRTTAKAIVAPDALAQMLAQVVKAAAAAANVAVPDHVRIAADGVEVSENAQRLADAFAGGANTATNSAILLGNYAQHHPQYAALHALAQALSDLTGAKLGVLNEAANSVGGYIAGAVPFGKGGAGKNAMQMAAEPLKAYLLLGVEPQFDTHDPARTLEALAQAELVVAMSPFEHAAEYAHVMLPIGPFTETSGTFINTEGRVQSFAGCVQPLGETRPAWKVLRVLGNLLGLSGFDYDSADEVKREVLGEGEVIGKLGNRLSTPALAPLAQAQTQGLQRIAEVPLYASDPLVRRSPPLQKTRDGAAPVAWVSAATFGQLRLAPGDFLRVRGQGAEVTVPVAVDERLPDGCVRLAAGWGAMSGSITAERVPAQQKVAV
ncbi:MAG TPA: NADH-quinone oxidoreductase subunit NuoG [Burkholderiales bacterium]|nr:NADH-quinone oxidoreductase subunit NuoG [Burkholderiales bacterium]